VTIDVLFGYIIHGTMHHLVGWMEIKIKSPSWVTISKLVLYLEEWFSYNRMKRFLFFKFYGINKHIIC
jgi:hypothetical protein